MVNCRHPNWRPEFSETNRINQSIDARERMCHITNNLCRAFDGTMDPVPLDPLLLVIHHKLGYTFLISVVLSRLLKDHNADKNLLTSVYDYCLCRPLANTVERRR
jgi:hypothetical protein